MRRQRAANDGDTASRTSLKMVPPRSAWRARPALSFGVEEHERELDYDLAFGWHPSWWNELDLRKEAVELDAMALRNWRMALRNWLRKPP
jgi:hypothetical protein